MATLTKVTSATESTVTAKAAVTSQDYSNISRGAIETAVMSAVIGDTHNITS